MSDEEYAKSGRPYRVVSTPKGKTSEQRLQDSLDNLVAVIERNNDDLRAALKQLQEIAAEIRKSPAR